MTIGEILFQNKPGISMMEIDILLSHILQQPKEYLYSHPEKTLTAHQIKKLESYIKRRQAGEPIAYITGHKEFFGLDFSVNNHVLIPRPDTELLVKTVINALHNNDLVLDVGTGSGNIAVTIKKHFKQCTMLASDISRNAL